MIQRIQSIYLLIVSIISGGLIFPFYLWKEVDTDAFFVLDDNLFSALFVGSSVLAFVSLFLFKSRKLQVVLGRLNILLNFVLLGFIVYRLLNLPGGDTPPEKGIGLILPLISIVFLVLANKAIKRDEDLVKSVDRLR